MLADLIVDLNVMLQCQENADQFLMANHSEQTTQPQKNIRLKEVLFTVF